MLDELCNFFYELRSTNFYYVLTAIGDKKNPPGAAKSVEVKFLSLRISCCSVGQVPAPRGRHTMKDIFTCTDLPEVKEIFTSTDLASNLVEVKIPY
jgi:hypothetical protein